MVLTRKELGAMCKAYKKMRKRTDTSDDETEASADESGADPGTGEPEQTASAAEGYVGKRQRLQHVQRKPIPPVKSEAWSVLARV